MGWNARCFPAAAGLHLVEIQVADPMHRHSRPPIDISVNCGRDFVSIVEWVGKSPQIIERPV